MMIDIPISKGFLIDGYPRDVAQAEEFERTISPCKQVVTPPPPHTHTHTNLNTILVDGKSLIMMINISILCS